MNSNVNYLGKEKEKSDQRFISKEDISKIFYDPLENKARDSSQRHRDIALNSSGFSQDEFGLISALSPIIRYSPFSPTRGAGVSFYETFAKRFDTKRASPDDLGKSQMLDFKPLSMTNGGTTEIPVDFGDRNAGSVFNYLNSSSNSFREMTNDRSNALNEPVSPLRLELWRVHSNDEFQNSNNVSSPNKTNNIAFGLYPVAINSDNHKSETEIVKLKPLCNVFEQIFINNHVSYQDIGTLNKLDEEILNSLLQRKFMKKLLSFELNMTNDRKSELINSIINSKSHKRPEECYKFVLTRVIKYLKRKLKDYPDCPSEVEPYLYDLYFKETSQKLNLPITDFHYPLTGNRGKFKLNSIYFDKIFKSEKFLEGVTEYINNVLFNEYKCEMSKKIESLLSRWDQQLQDQNANFQEVESSIKEYLLKNKRCKLPWTMKEVKESIERFFVLIRNYCSKK
jgi:hypothetical protein